MFSYLAFSPITNYKIVLRHAYSYTFGVLVYGIRRIHPQENLQARKRSQVTLERHAHSVTRSRS